MHCKINVLIFLGAILYLADAAPAKRTATTEQLVGILSWNSGQFVAVTSNGGLYATASPQNSAAHFTVRSTNDVHTFESASLSGQYLLVEDGELRLGTPSNNNDLFLEVEIPGSSQVAFKLSSSPPDCYMAFDDSGNVHSNICGLTTSDTATHFSLVPQ